MFAKPSILTRVAVGKLVGLLLGAVGFFAMPAFGVDDMKMRVGVLFWYVGIGAFIGMAGVITRSPVVNIPTPWWVMGPLIGAFMNFLLVLIAWDVFATMMANGGYLGLTSPWWGVAEGAIVGLVIGGLATLFGGEGPAAARALERA